MSDWGSQLTKTTIPYMWPPKTHLHRQAWVSFKIFVGQAILGLCSNRKTSPTTNTRKRSLPCCGTVICPWQHDSNYTFTKAECEETFLCSVDLKRQRKISTLPTVKLERRDIIIVFIQRCIPQNKLKMLPSRPDIAQTDCTWEVPQIWTGNMCIDRLDMHHFPHNVCM